MCVCMFVSVYTYVLVYPYLAIGIIPVCKFSREVYFMNVTNSAFS